MSGVRRYSWRLVDHSQTSDGPHELTQDSTRLRWRWTQLLRRLFAHCYERRRCCARYCLIDPAYLIQLTELLLYVIGTQFSLNDLEVITATVNLDRTWLAHFQPARRLQAATEPAFEEIKLDQILGFGESSIPFVISPSFPPMTLQPEEEIALATVSACPLTVLYHSHV